MNRNYFILSAGFLTLVLAALLNPNPFIFDERLFPPNITLMSELGFGKDFLLQMNDQAPGPLYEFVHLPLQPLTHLIPWRMRAVNILLFTIVLGVLYMYSRSNSDTPKQSLYKALHLVAIPTVWQVTGLALTEMPAMIFATLWFYLCNKLHIRQTHVTSRCLLISMLCGVALALAVMGRTPYLLLLGCGPLLFLLHLRLKNSSKILLVSYGIQLAIVLIAVVPVFLIWGGLVPPLQSSVEGALKPWHGILGIAYLGITGLILNVQWFRIENIPMRTLALLLGTTYVAFFVLNYFTSSYTYAPLSELVGSIGGGGFVRAYTLAISPLLACFAVYFLVCCYFRIRENIFNPSFILATLSAIIIALSAAKISHQFSSRYIAQAAPFMVVMFVSHNADSKDSSKWLRLIVALVIGFISLNTYAHII